MRNLSFTLAAMLMLATASFAKEPAKRHEARKSGVIDCQKTPNVHVGNGKLTLTFTGTCQSITIAGGMNEVVADSVVHLELTGAMNRVFVSRVDTIQLTGAKNDVTWSATVDATKTEPAAHHVGKDNVVKKGDKALFDAAKKVETKNVNAEAKKAEDDAKKAIDDATKSLGIKLN